MQNNYQRIETAISFIYDHMRDQPSLQEVALHVGLSPHHLQRMFRRWTGVSPKRFLEYLTVENAKTLLRQPKSVLDTTFELGLSSPARLHDQFVSIEAVTPGEYKSRGRSVEIFYGVHDSPFGKVLLAETKRGICNLWFIGEGSREQALESLRKAWPKSSIYEDQLRTATTVNCIFYAHVMDKPSFHLVVGGTNFQVNVWKALLTIPEGAIVSYKQLAEAIGRPTASRAVGNAVGANPIAYLIPCHRVLRATGDFGGYRWGQRCKRILLAWESARTAGDRDDEKEPAKKQADIL